MLFQNSLIRLFTLLVAMNILIICSYNNVACQSLCSTVAPNFSNSENELLCGMTESGPFYIKVYFHVTKSKTTGAVAMTPQQVKDTYNILQTDFAPHNIFFIWDCDIDYIENDELYDLNLNDIFTVNTHIDGIDIYLGREVGQGSCSDTYAFASGVPGKSFYVWGNFWKPPYNTLTQTHFVSHEMGHCLGLAHTFNNNQLCKPDNSNCCTCGDFVCEQDINHIAVEVDTEQFSQGIYIVTVYQPGEQPHQQKVVIAR